jgi:hypothetical protein
MVLFSMIRFKINQLYSLRGFEQGNIFGIRDFYRTTAAITASYLFHW